MEIDISNVNTLAVVVPTGNEGEQLALPSTGASKPTSPKAGLLSKVVDFSLSRPRGMITSLCVLLVVFVITMSLLSEMDAKTPEIFPEGHNQVEVKDLMEHFEPALTSSGFGWDANACTPNITGSACMLHWCEAPGPWDTPRDQCSCVVRPASGTTEQMIATCDTLDVKSRISGAGKSSLDSDTFKRKWAAHLQQAAPFAVGVGSDAVPGYVFSHEGYWGNPHSDEGRTSDLAECAEKCSHDANCTAFNRVDVQGTCFLYGSEKGAAKLMADSNNHAFVKAGGQVLLQDDGEASFVQLAMLTMEDWETGDIATHSFMESPRATIRLDIEMLNSSKRVANTTCQLEELCFCGGPVCQMPDWLEVRPSLKLESTSQRLLAEGASKQVSFSPGLARALTESSSGEAAPSLTVTLMYGIRPSKGGAPMFGNFQDIWSFDSRFEPENPWAQRAMLTVCSDIPEHLQVVDVKCWPQDFQAWMKETGKRFPTREFHSDVLAFISDPKKSVLKQYMWIRGDRMLATKIDFNARQSNELPGDEALELMDRWNTFILEHNRKQSVTANVAWHTSQTWVRAEGESVIKSSMVITIVISVVCAFLGMVVFTQNLLLALCVIAIASCVICGLSFFMVAIMGWTIGTIEAISLVVFVGYSMTYSMHIASIFKLQAKQNLPQSADVSEACARAAVLQIGGAIVGSAITTLISGFFLLFCTLQIFFKLGIVVLIVTLLSVTLALLVLPACLVVVWLPGMSLYYSIANRFRKKRNKTGDTCDEGSAKPTHKEEFETIVPGHPVS
jgi:hypothetical protein